MWNYLSIPTLQRLQRLSLEMYKWFLTTLDNGCDYLSRDTLSFNIFSVLCAMPSDTTKFLHIWNACYMLNILKHKDNLYHSLCCKWLCFPSDGGLILESALYPGYMVGQSGQKAPKVPRMKKFHVRKYTLIKSFVYKTIRVSKVSCIKWSAYQKFRV